MRHSMIKKKSRHWGRIYLTLRIFLLSNDNSFGSTIFCKLWSYWNARGHPSKHWPRPTLLNAILRTIFWPSLFYLIYRALFEIRKCWLILIEMMHQEHRTASDEGFKEVCNFIKKAIKILLLVNKSVTS
jgi:hypothetical protein